ncbi:MAG: hypothetical protein K6G10_06980 [Butyrivibrio sp.]|nr:hypothetical protein [Butyrivibrio sp.]
MSEHVNELLVTGKIRELDKDSKRDRIKVSSKQQGTGLARTLLITLNTPLPEFAKEPNANVNIKGHVEAMPYTSADGSKRTKQQFIADEINPRISQCEMIFGKDNKGKFGVPLCCIVHLSGTIRTAKKEKMHDGEWMRYVLDTTANGKPTTASLSHKLSDVPGLTEEYKQGDTICCVCNVETRYKVYNGRTHADFNDLTILDACLYKG